MTDVIRVADGPTGAAPAARTDKYFAGNVFELSTTPMLVIDDGQRIHNANAAAGVMFHSDDLDRRSLLDVFVPDNDVQSPGEMTALIGGDIGWLEYGGTILSESRRQRVSLRVDLVISPADHRLFLVQLRELVAVPDHDVRGRGDSHYRNLVSTVPGMGVAMFGRDLRLLNAVGELLDRGHCDASALAGTLLSDVFPAPVVASVEERFRAALRGQEADFEYDSSVDGRQYRIRLRPVIDDDGTVSGGLAVSEDVTADRARQTLLEQLQQFNKVGTVTYDPVAGWKADNELIALLGLDSTSDVLQAIDNLVVPEDRAPTRAAYHAVLASGGRTTVQYRVMHGKTGQLRHVMGAFLAVVNADGVLLRALATHVDITEAVQSQSVQVVRARARTLLLRSISDAFTQAPGSLRTMMQSIVDIATAVLGDSTVLRALTAGAAGVEADLVTDSDEQAEHLMIESLRESARAFVADPAILDASGVGGALLSTLRDPGGSDEFKRRLACPDMKPVRHFISAAVRHDGVVLGHLHVYRADPDNPYQDGDDHLVQVLADRIGAAIAETRVRELLERQRAERSATATRMRELTVEQRELLEQLSGVEERERMLLAEAIHDGPMQLVVAVMMRLENLEVNGEPFDQDGLDQSIDTLETSILHLRTLITALTPPDLSRGLGEPLRELAEGIFVGTTTKITVLGQAHVSLTALSKGNAHRILREALVNTRKHAQARHVVLELTEENSKVIARLTDNGVGATSLDAGPGHLGMATMRARADIEGADLDITSTPGTGTTVVLTMPAVTRDADGR